MPTPRLAAATKPRTEARTTSRTEDRRTELNREFGHPVVAAPAELTREQIAAAKLSEARSLVQKQQFEDANKILESILKNYSDTNAAIDAKTLRLECLEGLALALLNQAKERIHKKQFDQAVKVLNQLLEQYSNTSIVTEARALLSVCFESLASSKMRLAKPFIDRGDDAHAAKRLKEIISLYPKTQTAKDAEKALSKLKIQ